MKTRWKMVEVVDHPGQVPRELKVEPARFFCQVLDNLLPGNAVVVRGNCGFALDLVEEEGREPFIVEPLAWDKFLAELKPGHS